MLENQFVCKIIVFLDRLVNPIDELGGSLRNSLALHDHGRCKERSTLVLDVLGVRSDFVYFPYDLAVLVPDVQKFFV